MTEHVDICENRHRDNPESMNAFDQIAPKIGALHEQLLRALSLRDMTSKELERFTRLHRSTVSARLSELKKLGKIEATSARRDGCAVLTLVKGSRYRATESDLF
jgi:predicted HTH transcriptional regulator